MFRVSPAAYWILRSARRRRLTRTKIKFTANSVPIDSNTFSFVKKDSTHYQLILNKWLYENTEYRADFSEALKGSNGAALSSNVLVFNKKTAYIGGKGYTVAQKNADGSYTDITNAETGTIRITAKIKGGKSNLRCIRSDRIKP